MLLNDQLTRQDGFVSERDCLWHALGRNHNLVGRTAAIAQFLLAHNPFCRIVSVIFSLGAAAYPHIQAALSSHLDAP